MGGNKTTLTNHSEMFKNFYIPASDAAIHTASPFRTTVKRIENWTGKNVTGIATLSMGGGVGNDVIPVGSTRKRAEITYTPQALWATSVLDWEAVVASGDDKGAFFNVTVDEVEKTMINFTNNEERQFWGTSAGILGAYATNPTDNGDGTWTVQITAATWFYPNWEAGNVINFGTDLTPFEITIVDRADKQITVERRSGSFDPAGSASGNIYMQNSRNKELIGLKEIGAWVDNGSATGFGCRIQPRWEPRIMDASSKPLIPDMLTEMVELFYEDTGRTFSDIWLSGTQYAALTNQLEGKKEYTQLKSEDKRYADLGWKAVVFTSRRGDLTLNTARFCPSDEVYFTSRPHQEMRCRPKWGWLTFDGNKYLRAFTEGEKPTYKASYGGYGQYFHHPGMLGRIKSLEVPSIG